VAKGLESRPWSWLVGHIFETMPEIQRIEGYTRVDNLPMRQVFRQCGFVKEAHFRKGWFDDQHDKVGYAILREDWETKTITPVNWNDEL
jgi:RimJ/RimL family protein N-acetyltransferase